MSTPDINKILAASPRTSARGAPLGHRDIFAGETKLYLQRVRVDSGGYAPDGTYWGSSTAGGGSIWCAFNKEDDTFATAQGTCIYVRARSRTEAKVKVYAHYPLAEFVRSSS